MNTVFILIVFLAVWGGRGTLRSGPPLCWGDAFHSQHLFANHLALNGTCTLPKAAMETQQQQGEQWLNAMPLAQAAELVRGMLPTPRDELLEAEHYTLLRRHSPVNRLPAPPRNIVLIMMESFSAGFTGALGNDQGITPEFDRLASQGLLFDRFFSNGAHTHQGMFATLACFPNLPGYEYLMQQPEGQNRFSGLPVLLNRLGFNDLYIYNGDFSLDNQQGFFRNQGMSNFIGRDDFRNPVFIDPTWGVSDGDMFDRALGQFIRRAADSSWYKDTLFIIVGDHGFAINRQLTEIDLLRFRVPLLILGPGIRETYGAINHTVATQTDVVPTVVGLLGNPSCISAGDETCCRCKSMIVGLGSSSHRAAT